MRGICALLKSAPIKLSSAPANPKTRPLYSASRFKFALGSARFMFAFLIRLVISALGLLGIAKVFPGVSVNSLGVALIAALALGLVNAFVKPILQFVAQALTLPLSCLTLGLWSLVLSWLINGLMFLGVAKLVDGFDVKNLGAAMLGALALSVINAIASGLVRDRDKRDKRPRARN